MSCLLLPADLLLHCASPAAAKEDVRAAAAAKVEAAAAAARAGHIEKRRVELEKLRGYELGSLLEKAGQDRKGTQEALLERLLDFEANKEAVRLSWAVGGGGGGGGGSWRPLCSRFDGCCAMRRGRWRLRSDWRPRLRSKRRRSTCWSGRGFGSHTLTCRSG